MGHVLPGTTHRIRPDGEMATQEGGGRGGLGLRALSNGVDERNASAENRRFAIRTAIVTSEPSSKVPLLKKGMVRFIFIIEAS